MPVEAQKFTVAWALFSFRGRIGRKSFWLGGLFMILVQGALFSYLAGYGDDGRGDGRVTLNSGGTLLFGLMFLASWLATAWAALALAVKRLHDLDLPVILAICLIIPAIAFFAWLLLAVMPSKQVINEHGPPPFPVKEG